MAAWISQFYPAVEMTPYLSISLEKVAEEDAVRMIVWSEDNENGALSIHDIYQAPNDKAGLTFLRGCSLNYPGCTKILKDGKPEVAKFKIFTSALKLLNESK